MLPLKNMVPLMSLNKRAYKSFTKEMFRNSNQTASFGQKIENNQELFCYKKDLLKFNFKRNQWETYKAKKVNDVIKGSSKLN